MPIAYDTYVTSVDNQITLCFDALVFAVDADGAAINGNGIEGGDAFVARMNDVNVSSGESDDRGVALDTLFTGTNVERATFKIDAIIGVNAVRRSGQVERPCALREMDIVIACQGMFVVALDGKGTIARENHLSLAEERCLALRG